MRISCNIASKTKNNHKADKKKQRDFLCRVRDAFGVFARKTSNILGSAWSFVLAIAVIVIWAVTGPTFHYSDTWQLIINTGTTIVTFLMVFLIQNTQNRDSKAIHLKLDELIRALQGARNNMVDLEQMSDDDLEKLQEQFQRIKAHADKPHPSVNKAEAKIEKELKSR